MESTISDSDVVKSIALLWDILIYELGMRKIIEDLLEPYSQQYNFNTDINYQYPLSLLHSTGKFPDIKLFDNGKYWSPRLKLNQIRVRGQWHPVNKLNTNTFDQAELLVDIFRHMDKLDEVKLIIGNRKKLIDYLRKFLTEYKIGDLLKLYGLKLSNYTSYNRNNSAIGEQAESEVADYLQNKEYQILYRGGDGDPIDMTYGCDIIVSKDDIVLTVQVKLKELSAVKASKKSNYSSIDLFCWSENGSIGIVGDSSSLF